MDKKRILEVADAIENQSIEGLGFNMEEYLSEVDEFSQNHFKHPCKTIGCIAGWVYSIEKLKKKPVFTGGDIHTKAQNLLDLTEEEADLLFFGGDEDSDNFLEEITPEQAVKTLRNLAETGKVEWVDEKLRS